MTDHKAINAPAPTVRSGGNRPARKTRPRISRKTIGAGARVAKAAKEAGNAPTVEQRLLLAARTSFHLGGED